MKMTKQSGAYFVSFKSVETKHPDLLGCSYASSKFKAEF